MNINKVAVIGAGTMGNGIAHVFALYDYKVTLVDLNEVLLERALRAIESNLDRQLKKDIISSSQKENTILNIKTLSNIENIENDTNLIVEAIFEDKSVKQNLYKKLNEILNYNTIFATNTSSISITELALNNRPDRFIGMHFMNPVPIMKLVEIIRGYSTSDETLTIIKDVTKKLDKIPVEVNDFPGFISNRILMPMINEAIYALYENVGTVEDIDAVMKLGMNHPMGPLTLADFIGLDVCLNIMNVLLDGFNDPKYRPCPLLKKMVAANKLGRKTKEGFYKY